MPSAGHRDAARGGGQAGWALPTPPTKARSAPPPVPGAPDPGLKPQVSPAPDLRLGHVSEGLKNGPVTGLALGV